MTFEQTGVVRKFRYNVAAGRYQDHRGRFVPFSEIRRALDIALDNAEEEMLSASRSLQAGQMSLADWQQRMAVAIKDIHLASAALAKGGWGQMSQNDYNRISALVAKQYEYLQRFATQIENGIALDGNFTRRVGLYVQSGRSSYHSALRDEMLKRGKDEERSVLAVADHCKECVAEADKGWGPIGHIKLIGTRICRSNCRCDVEYK